MSYEENTGLRQGQNAILPLKNTGSGSFQMLAHFYTLKFTVFMIDKRTNEVYVQFIVHPLLYLNAFFEYSQE